MPAPGAPSPPDLLHVRGIRSGLLRQQLMDRLLAVALREQPELRLQALAVDRGSPLVSVVVRGVEGAMGGQIRVTSVGERDAAPEGNYTSVKINKRSALSAHADRP